MRPRGKQHVKAVKSGLCQVSKPVPRLGKKVPKRGRYRVTLWRRTDETVRFIIVAGDLVQAHKLASWIAIKVTRTTQTRNVIAGVMTVQEVKR